MTLKQSLIISLFIFFLSSSPGFSEEAKPTVRGPITVTSETLTSDNKAHTALFEKNVVAKTAEMTIYADRMLVYYKENTGEVTMIEASGNVKLYKNTRVITSGKATYYAAEDKVVFTGEPRAVDGENMITGSTMTYYITQDRSLVEHSKVYLKNKREK
jgi:lipopolysaccharide export system protein LptA